MTVLRLQETQTPGRKWMRNQRINLSRGGWIRKDIAIVLLICFMTNAIHINLLIKSPIHILHCQQKWSTLPRKCTRKRCFESRHFSLSFFSVNSVEYQQSRRWATLYLVILSSVSVVRKTVTLNLCIVCSPTLICIRSGIVDLMLCCRPQVTTTDLGCLALYSHAGL